MEETTGVRSGVALPCAPSTTPPGFMEADLVAHSGPTSKGSYVQKLTLTDIATGWTECAPVLVREQKLLTEVPSEMRNTAATRGWRPRWPSCIGRCGCS